LKSDGRPRCAVRRWQFHGPLRGFWHAPVDRAISKGRKAAVPSRRPHRGSVPSSECPRFGRRFSGYHACKCSSLLHADWLRHEGTRTLPAGCQRPDIAHTTSLRIILCRATESSEVLPEAIALPSEHVTVTVSMRSDAPELEHVAIHGRASGEVPCTMLCTARSRCDRSSGCCSAAAAVDLGHRRPDITSNLT
jgi:hypothetical protein